MKLKKLASLLMVAAMIVALAVPAFGATATEKAVSSATNSLTITATTNTPAIKMMVPSAVAVVINPYGLNYSYTPAGASAATTSDYKIISDVGAVKNLTQAPVKVQVKVAGTIAGGGAFATDYATAEDATDKKVFMFIDTYASGSDVSAINWAPYNDMSKSEGSAYVIGTTEVTVPAVILKASTDGTNAVDVFAFKLNGTTSGNLATGSWSTSDKITVKMNFTFTLNSGEE